MLKQVPNQPVVFRDELPHPSFMYPRRERTEDGIIAYGWRRFIDARNANETVDAQWLLRLPMTKAASRAMDAVINFAAERLKVAVSSFVVNGRSKRGWTTWIEYSDSRMYKLQVLRKALHHWTMHGEIAMFARYREFYAEAKHRNTLHNRAINASARFSKPKLVYAFEEWHKQMGLEAMERRLRRSQQGALCRAISDCLGQK